MLNQEPKNKHLKDFYPVTPLSLSDSQEEVIRINNEKNAVSIAENLIRLKGIEEVVILINGESVNVVVLEDDLTEAKVAQIQNIIKNELKVDVSNIHINEL